jgi:hypothetical protein
MKIDHLHSQDGRVHAINCEVKGNEIETGILCLIAFPENTCRIGNEFHSFLVDIPKMLRSGSERVKAFNTILTVLDHEQV